MSKSERENLKDHLIVSTPAQTMVMSVVIEKRWVGRRKE
jgi:hypothetical protein